MRAVCQRVKNAELFVDGKSISAIDKGFLVYIGFCDDDTELSIQKALKKVKKQRLVCIHYNTEKRPAPQAFGMVEQGVGETYKSALGLLGILTHEFEKYSIISKKIKKRRIYIDILRHFRP